MRRLAVVLLLSGCSALRPQELVKPPPVAVTLTAWNRCGRDVDTVLRSLGARAQGLSDMEAACLRHRLLGECLQRSAYPGVPNPVPGDVGVVNVPAFEREMGTRSNAVCRDASAADPADEDDLGPASGDTERVGQLFREGAGKLRERYPCDCKEAG